LTDSDIYLLRYGKPFCFIDEGLATEWTIYPFAFVLNDGAKNIHVDWEHTEFRFIKPDELHDYDTVPRLQQSLSRILVSPETEIGLKALKDDHHSGAGVLASIALVTLSKIVQGEDLKSASTADEFWREFRMVAWHLAKNGRPSMAAAIEAAVFKAMDMVIAELPNPEAVRSMEPSVLGNIVERCIETIISRRGHNLHVLGRSFEQFIVGTKDWKTERKKSIVIVTLSSSSTVTRSFAQLILNAAANELNITLRILESRPMFEGVAFANALLDPLVRERYGGNFEDICSRLQVEVYSDASVAMVVKNADFVVIGADKVSQNGDVSNKIGSLAAAVLAKALQPKCIVVAVFEADKISCNNNEFERDMVEYNDAIEVTKAWPSGYKTTLEERKEIGYRVEVKNAYFEWVPAAYIDQYITEEGVLTMQDIQQISEKKVALEERIFGDL
jgi:translation initiation factor 2B subunit (eIF-2B alpha/beta/delta family)